MFNLLVVLILLASNAYEVASVILDSSFLTQLGYNNESTDVNIGDLAITDIDPNAFKGYTQLKSLRIQPSSLSKIDLGLFKDSIYLQTIFLIGCPSLTELTNLKKILFPFMQRLILWSCSLINLDSNVINALPNLTVFHNLYNNQFSPLKPNQLSSWKKLQTLFIEAKNQSSLTKAHFTGLNSLSSLIFSSSNIKTVEVHTLLALPNVTYVDFTSNDITAFEYLQIPEKLSELYLGGNKMNYFMLSRTMGFIRTLSIAANRFRSFKSMDFTFLANLTYLDLSNNPHAYPNEIPSHLKPLVNLNFIGLAGLSINTIDSNYFKQNIKLDDISLRDNNIRIISYDAFRNLKLLSEIDLSFNQISLIDNRTFVGLDNLKTIYLQNNKLTKIAYRTFYNLSALVNLELTNNLISEVESSAFSGCSSLYFLRLGSNRISKLPPRSFENLNLFSLELFYNQITEIDNSSFNGMITDYLHLSNNNISIIGPGTFNNVSIHYLHLSYNRLTKLYNEIFFGIKNLGYIYITNNMISTIETGAFNGLTNLQTIDLTNNMISAIEVGTFNALFNLQYIYLDNNNLTQLDNSTFTGCNKLQGIKLYNNPNLSKNNLQSLCPTDAMSCSVYFN